MLILLLEQCAREIHKDKKNVVVILALILFVIVLILLVVGFSWRMVFALHKRYRRVIGSQGGIRVQAFELYRMLREPEGRLQI